MERFLVLFLAVVAFPHATPESARGPGLPIPDSIQQDLDAGRFWKASVELRAHLEPLGSASATDRLILAEAEAGWKNWPGVIEVLEAGAEPEGGPAHHWFLLGTARHRMGDVESGVKDLERFLQVAPAGSPATLIAESRLLQAADTDSVDVLVRSLLGLRASSPVLSDWTALELARALSSDGRPQETSRLLDLIVDPAARGLAWSWVADAWAVGGDTASALAALENVPTSDEGGPAPTDWLDRVWRLRLATGDTAGSRAAAAELLAHTVAGSKARAAATQVLEGSGSDMGVETLLLAADALSRGGEHRQALDAWTLAVSKGAELSEAQRLGRARALGAVGDRLAANREYQTLASAVTPAVAAPSLVALARARRREGLTRVARELEDSLVARFPTRSEALNLVYLRGDDHQDAGRVDTAIEHYRQVIAMSSSADRAGLARMRWGHIHLTRLEYDLAVEVFEGYLAEFPEGRRWEEASYWGAWAARQMGDEARARRLIEKLNMDNPLSYYAVMATQLGPYSLELNFADGSPLPEPDWLSEALEVLELLEAADLEEGTKSHVNALKAAAWDSEDVLMRLAVELNARGRTMDGINLGWELRRRGRPWDKRLLRVIYPFPYRAMVLSFAKERDLDPYLLAGLIRQESAFVPDIVSRAGAIGLMQVIPSTGRQVARSVGPKNFRSEALTTPEVNVHLGTRFLADLLRRYDDLPLVLSAYNAGPTRADRWKKFPEAGDAGRFTERIPFAETRGYVKNVTRNRALYRYLYGDSELDAADR